ncbi:MAG: GNAT family N-acetyltransferase [Alphaproteobacteria bacterium]|jgi:GNAT superfamily N-acetyltransferase|nr:GNAT family N-acetyltransferase [Alphaproteobacteria bacterium]
MKIQRHKKEEFSEGLLAKLKPMLDNSYFNSKMFASLQEDLKQQHSYFLAFVAYEKEDIVGFVVVEDKYQESMKEVYGDQPPVHIKRFCVSKNFRGNGIGKQLLDEAKKHAFEELNLKLLFGESNESYSCGFYGNQGAMFHMPTLISYNTRISPEDNIKYFKTFSTDIRFSGYRYQSGHGLAFVFCNDNEIKEDLLSKGFLPYKNIIK